jgi:hypothetical protein
MRCSRAIRHGRRGRFIFFEDLAMRRFHHLLVVLTLIVAGAGCELLVHIDPSLLPGAGGSGGTGGAGVGPGTGGTSSATGTGGMTGTGGKTGTGGTTASSGTGGGCATAADCPPSTGVCATAACDPTAHTCGIVDVAAGGPAAASAQIQGDCKQVVCDGSGNPMSVTDDTDVPDDGEVCTDDSCSGGAPVHAPNSDTCTENNGKVCGLPAGPKAGKCVACNVDADCPTGGVCQLNKCVTSSCNDQVQEPPETDVDCGGLCAPCPDHDKCLTDQDCQSDNCSLAKICTPASCTDEVQNEGETDVDCGGPVCGAEGKLCGTGKTCAKAGDCQSDNCDTTVAHTCKAPTCLDGILNQGETDTDCGGPNCGGCANGKKCLGDGDCTSMGCQVTGLTCVPQCTDGRKDGLETDVDCGGVNACPRCSNTQACMADGDCASNACDAISNTCIANQCLDHRQDGAETDQDCGGGGTCGACGLGKMCKVNSDCVSVGCQVTTLLCVVQCADGSKDGAETDIDCGGGTCGACGLGKGCHLDTDCTTSACQTTAQVCVTPCTDGHVDGAETDIDCGGGTCGPCGAGQGCKLDTDCTTSACDAVSLTCAANQCVDHQQDGMETDQDCGGGTCPTCAAGQKCLANADCTSTACDAVSLLCVANQCVDEHVDNTETDVDCGGGTCGGCAVGQKCLADTDCVIPACDAVSLLCAASQCSDRHVDGAETDVDCGGGTCPACPANDACTLDSDCASNACDSMAHTCAADHCGDHHQDAGETDVDCGGPCSGCPVNDKCEIDGDCASTACDGISLLCVADECSDDRRDGNETDVDCGGGGTCPTCGLGLVCVHDSDCTSNACDGVSFTCTALQCADHQQDGPETDVDCGGGCPGCILGGMCMVNTDCETLACDGISHTCGPDPCTDHHLDGAETDVDCGGGTCGLCGSGKNCVNDSDCSSTVCQTADHTCM